MIGKMIHIRSLNILEKNSWHFTEIKKNRRKTEGKKNKKLGNDSAFAFFYQIPPLAKAAKTNQRSIFAAALCRATLSVVWYFRQYKDQLKLSHEKCVELTRKLSASKTRFSYEYDKLLNQNYMLERRQYMTQVEEECASTQNPIPGSQNLQK